MAVAETFLNKSLVTSDSPMYFGAEGDVPQPTFLSDEAIIISSEEREALIGLTVQTAKYMRSVQMTMSVATNIGVSPDVYSRAIEIDSYGRSDLVYGGLDVSRDSSGRFKVIEINPRVQAMGLQDFRQEVLDVKDNQNLLDSFALWLHQNDYTNITLLGSTKNAFYRGYDRITRILNSKGVSTIFTDTVGFKSLVKLGYQPQLIFRNCANGVIMDDPEMVNIIRDQKIRIVNPLHASFYGYRGFLKNAYAVLPEALPEQITLDKNSSEADLSHHPWLKLEAGGEEYVVNYGELRQWGKMVICSILRHDFESSGQILSVKTGGDAVKLQRVQDLVERLPEKEVVWIAQEDIEPVKQKISVDGRDQDVRLLYRTYFLYQKDGSISVSAECFGCLDDQFKRSKGKINAGTGFSVPIGNFY